MNTCLRLLALLALLLPGLERSEAQWTPAKGPYSAYVCAIAESGPNLLAGTASGIYRSSDHGAHWTLCNTGRAVTSIQSFAVNGPLVMAAARNGILLSDDQGATWTWANGDIPEGYWNYVLFAGNYLYAGNLDGLYRSGDGGRHWTLRFSGGAGRISSIVVVDTSLFIATSYNMIRTDLGSTRFVEFFNGLSSVRSLAVIGKTLFASNWQGVHASTDLGATWKLTNLNVKDDFQLYALENRLFAVSPYSGIYYTSDNGVTWSELHTGLVNPQFKALALSGSTLVAGMDDGIHQSSDNGDHWDVTNEGLLNVDASALAVADNDLFVATRGVVSRSSDQGNTWTRLGSISPDVLFGLTIGDSVWYAASWKGVSRSTDHGATWSVVGAPVEHNYINSVWTSGSIVCAGRTQEGFFRSTDYGGTWSVVDVFWGNYSAHAGVNKFIACGSDLFALSSKMYRSSDQGATWVPATNGMIYQPTSLAASGSVLYAGTYGGGVYRSTDRGDTWNQVSAGLPYHSDVTAVAVAGSKIIACVPDSGIYLSTNEGYSWSYAGTAYSRVNTLVIQGGNIYAGTNSTGLWKRPLSELVTSAGTVETVIPRAFSLSQNYPNPFNPSTTISFDLPARSTISLTIFNALGQEIARLASESLPAGSYQRMWNAAGFPSGVYFYRLQADDFTETKRLLLLK
ncbi:MAG: T9SS type A sorting domain-containing protein [Acidobacteriota bacterium]